ncbi:hypothetical protein HN604_03390 [archaeon]|jgi:hypothetical protein|nr:hypothetical protein [archaeon]MBT6182372.1 hypothetical protein [archaeon]MBT6606537.1 hypothetical protein [archaeon]MBT7251836.1 hypothetical protein [archaeon]MBT7661098.1 hypothetical protein [archaeon]
MKKEIGFLLMSVFLIGMVFAAQGEGTEAVAINYQGGAEKVTGIQQIKAGNYLVASGEQIQIKEQAQNQFKLEVGDAFAHFEGKMTQEQVGEKIKLMTQLKNGKNVEVKIMPDVASETALEKLRLKNCVESEGCLIELKEVGQGEDAKLSYELKTQRQSKIFGLFKARMKVEAQVDAQTGELIDSKKPWWAFLATEPAE